MNTTTSLPKAPGRGWGIATIAMATLLFSSCQKNDRFRMADTNRDKVVSSAEFERYMLETIFAMSDADRDSKVTFAEWKAANPSADPTKFSVPDTDGDGAVTPAEARAHFQKYGTMADLFSQIDANADGSLTREEASAFIANVQTQAGSTPLERLSQASSSK